MEEILYLVPHKEELPKVNKVIKVRNFMSDKEVDFKVKTITELRWNGKGDLICALKGKFV